MEKLGGIDDPQNAVTDFIPRTRGFKVGAYVLNQAFQRTGYAQHQQMTSSRIK
jgi:hypothetical protein